MMISKLQSQVLLEAAASGKSGEEMEEMFGIPAAQAIVHVQERLKQRNIWTAFEQEQLLLEEWHIIKAKLYERINERDDDKSMTQLIAVLREVGRVVETRQKATDKQINEMAAIQAKLMMGFLMTAYNASVAELSHEYPEIDTFKLTEIFEKQITAAIV